MNLSRTLKLVAGVAILVSIVSLVIYSSIYFDANFAFGDNAAQSKLRGSGMLFIALPAALWICVIIISMLNTPPSFKKDEWTNGFGPSTTKTSKRREK